MDASFANNKDLSSQISYIIILADVTKKANIIYWSLIKCKRVTRSVLASKLYRMAYGFDIAVAIKSMVDKILSLNPPTSTDYVVRAEHQNRKYAYSQCRFDQYNTINYAFQLHF